MKGKSRYRGRSGGRRPANRERHNFLCYPLPKDVLDVLPYETAGLENFKFPISNFGLLFHRYIAYPKEWSGEIGDVSEVRQKLAGTWELEGRVKNEVWRFLERQANDIRNSKEIQDLIGALRKRMDDILEAYEALKFKPRCFNAEVVWRLAVGLGTAGATDTGMTLHRIFGIPYIPASAVKGLAHHYAVEEKGMEEHKVVRVFGDQTNKGKVVFLDAIPIDYVFQLDIINPHYGPYYQGKEPPADYHSPRPVYFLTVGRQSTFKFCLLSKCKDVLDDAEAWLKEALHKFGIGAKTRAGYGEMEV